MALAEVPLTGKTALVTGGIRGIGRAISLELAKRGANVAMVYANASRDDTAKQAVEEIIALTAGGKAAFNTKRIDIVVHNAAIGGPVSTAQTTEELYDRIMDTNVRAPFFLTRTLLPYIPEGGRIILISSIAARRYTFGMAQTAYGASKAALEALARGWAVEFGHSKAVTVNALSVGSVETEILQSMSPEQLDAYRNEYVKMTAAAPRAGTPDDIAQIVAFIASEESRWVTGSTISANGGRWPI
ncbi:hypothetical protein NQ176_g3049 [Zarea fungicola]|uniref:Uncharacterized protein n=1 Tax=Zarea fungicola TaxID=93591 RepID=A0ACC1NMM4_9HYPO|nr:hypothetical protein NQ176_g3049 [Lecanicillium fungicola]